MLFSINLKEISLTALIVFYLVKLHPQPEDRKAFSKAQKRAVGQISLSCVLIVVINVSLVYFTDEAASIKFENKKTFTVLEKQMPDEQVYSMDIIHGQELKIDMILLCARAEASSLQDTLEKKLETELGKTVKLVFFTIGETK